MIYTDIDGYGYESIIERASVAAHIVSMVTCGHHLTMQQCWCNTSVDHDLADVHIPMALV